MAREQKIHHVVGGYDWHEVVTAYMDHNYISGMDEIIMMTPKADKQYAAIASQLVAEAWGVE